MKTMRTGSFPFVSLILRSLFVVQVTLATALAAPPQSIGSYQVVTSTRFSRTAFDYELRAKVTSSLPYPADITARVTSSSASTIVLEDTLLFGTVPAGGNVLSSDTFKVRQDRTTTFSPTGLNWSFTVVVAPPTIAITSPADGTETMDPSIQVTGTIGQYIASVDVNGIAAAISGSTFTATVPLVDGDNALTATATHLSGQTASATVHVILNTHPTAPVVVLSAQVTKSGTVGVSGTAAGAQKVQIIGGASTIEANVNNGAFSATVPLNQNQVNRLYVTGIAADGETSPPTPAFVLHDAQPPSLFIDFPIDGATLTTDAIDVAGRVGDMLSGFMGLTVTVNGVAAEVDVGIGNNGTFERKAVPLALGPNTFTAVATDELGNSVSRRITVTRAAIPADVPTITVVSGNGQKGVVHQSLAQPAVVKVARLDGTPFINKLVNFKVIRSDGRLTSDGNGSGALDLQVRTDDQGLARAFWKLGGDAGCGNNRMEVTARDVIGTTFFCASAAPGPAAQINVGEGNNQRAEAGGPAAEALRAWVSDSCNGIAGVPVTFTVTQGGGKVNGQSTVTITTSRTGHAQVDFVLGPDQGYNIVEANFPNNSGQPATFMIFGVVRDETQPTTFSGLVLDNSSRPIGGATCVLQVGGASIGPISTDVNGQFSFTGVPSGPAHFHVDGLPATMLAGQTIPSGSYPALTFSLVLIPNAQNQLPMPVLLPKLNPNNARTYDGTTDLVLTCEGMEGLRMIIKAGSMRRPDGSIPSPSNPAIVALNQVHHDDVPMPIPDGAAPPFAWTLQPGGSTFDPPIQIEYPNMSGLPAGAIAFFLSFNHGTERFEIVSSGHVSEDGSIIVTDPGGGLSLAGWGCNCPPYSATADCEGCKFTCKTPGTLQGGTVDVAKEVVCENQTITFTASGVTHVGGELEKDCPKTGKSTVPISGTPKYKWKITSAALPTPLEGEGVSAQVPSAKAGRYVCTFTARVEDPPGAQVSCLPSEKTLPVKEAHAVKIELVTPAGDPVNAPVNAGDGQNEFTFSAASPGVLTINFKAKVTPNTADLNKVKDLVVFTIENVGLAPTWAAANPGGQASVSGANLVATAEFSGLPANNSDFGPKKATLKCDGTEVGSTILEVFYPILATNHPGGDQTPTGEGSGRSQNWFYYWNQVAGDPDALYNDTLPVFGRTPALRLWSPTMTYNKNTIWIAPISRTSDSRRDGSGQTVTGIDLFANVVAHENRHVKQISDADALLGGLNGKAGSIWNKGWSWNTGPNNHWTLGPDGKPGKAGVDDDADGKTDEDTDLSEIGFAGSDDVDLDTDDNDVPNSWEPDTIEGQAGDAETIAEDTHLAQDWGNPGKQHATLKNYND